MNRTAETGRSTTMTTRRTAPVLPLLLWLFLLFWLGLCAAPLLRPLPAKAEEAVHTNTHTHGQTNAHSKSNTNSHTKKDTATVLRIWVSEVHYDRLVAIEYLTRTFETLFPGITVELTAVEENQFVPAFRRSLQNGTTPALVGTASDLVVALGEMDALDPEATSRALNLIGRSRFYRGPLSLLERPQRGQYYGLPFHGWIQGIWYRSDWFERENLEPPATWEAILKAAEVFTQPEKGIYGILVGTKRDHYAGQVFTHLAISNGARMFDNGRTVFNSPAMVETLEYYTRLAAFSPPGEQTWRGRDYYLQGRLAMMFYSTFIMDDLALPGMALDSLSSDNFPDLPGAPFDPHLVHNTGMVSLITARGNSSYGMVNALGLVRLKEQEKGPLRGAGDDAHAYRVYRAREEFLRFLYAPHVYISWLHMAPGGMLPVFRDIAGQNAFMRDLTGVFRRYGRPKMHDIIQGLETIRNFGHENGEHQPAASVVYARNVLPDMIAHSLSGNMTAEQAVRWAHARIEEIVHELDAGENSAPAPQ